jgi:nucleoside-diphosphate-sugar epimerase
MAPNIEPPGGTILVTGCAGFIGHGVVRALPTTGIDAGLPCLADWVRRYWRY